MPLSVTQKQEVEEVLKALQNTTSSRHKRRLADMFEELPNRQDWAEYYEIIPEPRCFKGIRANLAKNKYKDALDVYTDLDLLFLNALYYNEEGSQIAKDASTLKGVLEAEWKRHSALPAPRTSPPAFSAQRRHAATTNGGAQPTPKAPAKAKPMLVLQPQTTAASGSSSQAAPGVASPDRQPSAEMDVDIGGTPEPEGPSHESTRDAEADDIVRQLEKGLPRWEGFGGVGWMREVGPHRLHEIVLAVSSYQDANGVRLAASLEAVPEEVPGLPFNFPLSLSLIQSRAQDKSYESAQSFDKEISQLFMMGRRTYKPGSEEYGRVLVLQRLYHALTSANPPSPPYTTTTNFASIRAGPGTAKPMHASGDAEDPLGVTTYRVSTKDRNFIDEVRFKGWSVRLADWLHMSNPDDASRPIVGQVFRCFISDEPARKGQPGVTVCWYHRPEQTFHPAHRQFWEGEVFKTSHFADHPLEDIIEKIAVQFTARHIRGRPRPPYWCLGWPLYVCDSRYNDRERIFVKIKNWNSCVPEEVRKSTEFMPIYPFERTVFPRRIGSPFLGGKIKGPGGIGDVIEKAEGEKVEGGGTGRKRPKRNAGGSAATAGRTEQSDRAGPNRAPYAGVTATQSTTPTPVYPYAQVPAYSRTQSAQQATDRSIATAAGLSALGNNVSTVRLPPETAKHFDRDPETNEVLWFAAPPVDRARPRPPQHSLAYLHFLARKRKKAQDEGGAMGVEDVGTGAPSTKRMKVQPTVTETLGPILLELAAELSSSA